jgi:hypothetical protein
VKRLAQALRVPLSVADLDPAGWIALISAARAEQLIGSLAFRLEGQAMPDDAACILADARASAEQWRRSALWEAEMARRALAHTDIPVILMKGTAYVAAGLDAGVGRAIGDLDIMVPRDRLKETEDALIAVGWEWVKANAYDDAYYRDHMHELPPLIHRDRDRMIDVHHTILPLTARPKPDAEEMVQSSRFLPGAAAGAGLRIFSPEDMVLHCIAHLFADGDLAGGLRNLWDLDRLLREFGANTEFIARLKVRARLHGLDAATMRALRIVREVYGTPVDASPPTLADRFFIRRLYARDGWGRETRPWTRFAFYIRGHWLRMPPLMLARHLWTKWRQGQS